MSASGFEYYAAVICTEYLQFLSSLIYLLLKFRNSFSLFFVFFSFSALFIMVTLGFHFSTYFQAFNNLHSLQAQNLVFPVKDQTVKC